MRGKSAIVTAGIAILVAGGLYLFTPQSSSTGKMQDFLVGDMAKLRLLAPEPVPPAVVMREDGSPVALNEFGDKVLLINIWASWCAPCRAEMPELAHLQRELGDEHFEVVAVSADRGGIEQARTTLRDWGISGLALYADPTTRIAFDVARGALPTNLIVNRKGEVIAEYLGPLKWDGPEALALFQALKEERIKPS